MRLNTAALCVALILSTFSFSTYGRQVVFPWTDESGKQTLSMVNVDGTGYQPLPQAVDAREPVWSPDGRFMLFTASPSGGLSLFDPNKKTTRPLRKDLDGPAAWREDGKRFVAVRRVEGQPLELVWFDVSDSAITHHMPLPAAVTAIRSIVWLPESDDVALLAGDGNIYTVEAGEASKVTTSNDVLGMALSTDETKLLWARRSPNLKYILLSFYSFDLSKRSAARLPFPDRVAAINPDPQHAPASVDEVAISPDSSHLALVTRFDAAGGTRYYAVYSVKMSGEDGRLVEKSSPAPPGGNAAQSPLSVAWSPDGKRLAVLSTAPNNHSLTLYNADGSNPRSLKSEPVP